MKKKLLSFVLFFVFLFVLFNVSVNASEVPAAPVADEEEKITYLTDNPNYEDFVLDIFDYDNYFENLLEITYYDNTLCNSLYFIEYLQNMNLADSIETRKVIVEFYYEFDLLNYCENNQYYTPFEDFNLILCDFFSSLKDNGCEILLICATDQDKYEDQRDFLNYVDFHIDTDKFYYFVESIFAYLEDNGFDLYSGFTFFLSESLSYEWFFKKYLIPYYSNLDEYIIFTSEYEEILERIPAKIYCQEFNSNYYNVKNHDEMIDLFDYELNDYNLAFIGMGARDEYSAYEYLDGIIDFNNHWGMGNNNFFYNSNCYDLSCYSSPEVWKCNNWRMDTPSLLEMVLAFITDSGYTTYQNWNGLAQITHKMLTFGTGGWMLGNSGRYSEVFNLDTIVQLYLG